MIFTTQRTIPKLFSSAGRTSRTFCVRVEIFNSFRKSLLISNDIRQHCIHFFTDATLYATNAEDGDQKLFPENVPTKHNAQWWTDYLQRVPFEDRCVNRISRYLQCTEHRASHFISKYPLIFLDKIDVTLGNAQFLLERNISKERIWENVKILELTTEELKVRMSHLEKWNIDKQYLGDFLPLLLLPILNFYVVSNRLIVDQQEGVPHGNRVLYLSEVLKVPANEIARRLASCEVVFRCGFNRIESALQCYQKFDIHPEKIVGKLSSLTYGEDHITKRLSDPFAMGLQPLCLTLVTCDFQQYKKKLKKFKQKMSSYSPYENFDEYVTHKLFTHKEKIPARRKKMATQYFRNMDAKRFTTVLEFLLDKKFSPYEICANCEVFLYTVETLKTRYEELQKIGVLNPTITVLKYPPSVYEDFIAQKEFTYGEIKDIIPDMRPLVS